MNYTTQCTNCQTKFRVTQEQLSMADDFVRCGRCSHVFNARDHLDGVALVADVKDDETLSGSVAPHIPNGLQLDDSSEVGAQINTYNTSFKEVLRNTNKTQPQEIRNVANSNISYEDVDLPGQEDEDELQASQVGGMPASTRQDSSWKWLIFLASMFLLAQVIYGQRNMLVETYPELHEFFGRICSLTGCRLPLPRLPENILTEYSKLDSIPNHPNFVELTVHVKNHGTEAQNYPYLDLSLKDLQDQVVIRRLIKPQEYLSKASQEIRAFHPHTTHHVRLRMDTGDKSVVGYAIRWVY